MRLAQHLAVLDVRAAALAPRRDVVGIHFLQFPNLGVVGIVTDGAEGAVALALGLGCSRLLGIDGLLRGLVEHAYIQQPRVLTAIEDVFVDASFVLDVETLVEFLHLGHHLSRVVGRAVEPLIELAPSQPAHLLLGSHPRRCRPIR